VEKEVIGATGGGVHLKRDTWNAVPETPLAKARVQKEKVGDLVLKLKSPKRTRKMGKKGEVKREFFWEREKGGPSAGTESKKIIF